MPIDLRSDRDPGLIRGIAHGMFTQDELYEFQQELKKIPGIGNRNILIDLNGVTDFLLPPA